MKKNNGKGQKKFSIKDRLLTFKHISNGFRVLWKEEHNARIHIITSIVVIILSFVLKLSFMEWLIILVLITLVLSLEIINSAIENICDYISPEWHQSIKKIKDLSASAVFLAAIVSVICGIIIFLPKLCDFIK
ncbi:diacylglycerol kinase family protein [Dysgonomonas sp. Marseille-P4677]|uniref:diacylglycerol kinase family protein n=1 Tax=Dysgonomonas sp. Marseille-P4677 TaxID=2364790 RepID=UPI00191381B0|nr:diacylglycerol kinase family protein [Dysgonomonas sp. Marseille-P4677]MBK5720526.1 diacylglycerol kinase family protein [Dysgonomonas sp. Marseille-P4677]